MVPGDGSSSLCSPMSILSFSLPSEPVIIISLRLTSRHVLPASSSSLPKLVYLPFLLSLSLLSFLHPTNFFHLLMRSSNHTQRIETDLTYSHNFPLISSPHSLSLTVYHPWWAEAIANQKSVNVCLEFQVYFHLLVHFHHHRRKVQVATLFLFIYFSVKKGNLIRDRHLQI